MASIRSFLIVDDDPHTCLLVSTTLSRHYPNAVIQGCEDTGTAVRVVQELPPAQHQTVVVVHRPAATGGRELVAAMRAAHASVPIVWMGNSKDGAFASAAGANRFLDQEAWLSIGTTVQGLG